MKKTVLFLLVLMICGCVEVGKFPEHRERLHNLGTENDKAFCEQNPDRCYNGIPW